MAEVQVILGLLVVMGLLLALAHKLQIAYPILLVLGGLLIGLIAWLTPGFPRIELEPDIVLLLFLPPIIQAASFFTPIRDFRSNLRAIGLLAIGLVLFTTLVVGLVAHLTIGELSWAAAFVLGAIVAPPDAVAATAIAARLRLPRRVVTVLEGESLVNDATAIVAYRVALTAVSSGTFSPGGAAIQFLIAAVGGILVGVVISWLAEQILKVINDTSTTLIFSFLTGYATYILAERVTASGVIAVVTLGLLQGRAWRSNTVLLSPQTRVQVELVWDSVISLFNGILFILLGLQLPIVMEGVLKDYAAATLALYAVIVCLTVILARIVWMPLGTYLPRLLFKKIRENDPNPPVQYPIVLAWTGMRGVVSLAIALSIPDNATAPFPVRDLIIFLTFCVILATLVIQGLTLPPLIRLLKIPGDTTHAREDAKARWMAAKAGQERLLEVCRREGANPEMIQELVQHYDARIRRFSARYQGKNDEVAEEWADKYVLLQQELLQVEFEAVVKLRNSGVISDEVLHEVQRDLDLELIRLDADHTEMEEVEAS